MKGPKPQSQSLSFTAGNFHTGPAHSRTAAAAGQKVRSATFCSFHIADLVLAGSLSTVRGLPEQGRIPAAAQGSSAGWDTAAGSRSAAVLCPAGTQPAADCTGSSLQKEGAQSHFGAVQKVPCHPQDKQAAKESFYHVSRGSVPTVAQVSYGIFFLSYYFIKYKRKAR